ncbi:MAG: hypothetical protein HRT74_13515 [Flavobacteriales bacterium]|nr:hypothetical protein [Flavobacteriales bacterium]
MNITEEKGHEVLQKMIMIFLALLTVTVIMTSCQSAEQCAAYGTVDQEIEQQD